MNGSELPMAEMTAGRSETERLAALARTGIMDTPPEARFDDLVTLVKAVCQVPIALVTLVDSDRQWFKARSGIDVTETPIDTSVCALAIRQRGLFVIADLAIDPRTEAMALVRGEPRLRFYAGYPIFSADGMPLGSLCAIDTKPRAQGLDATQALALEALARQAGLEIECERDQPIHPFPSTGSHSIGMWDWDVAQDRVTADAGFARLYGVAPDLAVRGAPIAQFFGGIHPADLPALQAAIDRALATGAPFAQEYRLIGADERPRWVAAQGRCILSPDGRPLRFPGVSFDIDARKQAEIRLAALVELNDRLDRAGDPGDVAYAASEILGRTLGAIRVGYGLIDPVAETISTERDWCAPGVESYPDLLHFRDFGNFIDELKQGDTVTIDDLGLDPRTAAMAEAAHALQVHALVNLPIVEQGRFVALLFVNDRRTRHWSEEEVAFIREVAERTRSAVERRRAEQDLALLTASLEAQVESRTRELMVAEEHLRQAQKMEAVGQLTGGLAHDFNNLLTGISGAIEMMQVRIAQGRAGELDRYAQAAQGAARRAAALTHRLLAFSRRQTLDPKPTDVNRLVAGMEDLVRRTVGPRVTVETVGAGGLWATMIDPNQLENALLNLCLNARDAMPDGGRITIETSNKWLDERAARDRDLEPGQYVSLCVTDTGCGMTPEVQARVFDPFYTTKPLGEGTGLGLSMIYGFARQSGGQVRIYSEVGRGTTMCLYLPRHYGEADMVADQPVIAIEPADGHARTVLVVDDEPTIRMLVIEVLEELGYHVLEAGDGAGALRALDSGVAIDLLVTDVGLPGQMNGRQVADAALARRPDLKILFITGYAENAVIGNGQLDPNMALVTKPFAMDALASRIRGLLA
jgi:signal transduction histidine kinase/PAS domain-containing protein